MAKKRVMVAAENIDASAVKYDREEIKGLSHSYSLKFGSEF